MSSKIKWGILGYAKIAREKVMPAIEKSSNSELYAVASRDSGKLEKCAEDFKCSKLYGSYEELLDDPEVQAVYIPLPNSLHKEWTIKAARKGKHVLCEKPVALNSAECEEMMEECKKNNVKLMEAFMYRYTERTKKVKELLDKGLIGDVKYINSSFRFHLKREKDVRTFPELGGGSLYDVGCYPINFIGMVTGCEPISMSAEATMLNGIDVNFSGVLKYENGIICTISSGFNSFFRVSTEIVGTKGVMEIPNTFSDEAGTIKITDEKGSIEYEVKKSERYILEIEDFADAIINDRAPLFGIEETLRNMRIIEKFLETIKYGE